MTANFANREAVMRRAIDLARQGAGFVEPNPMVGAVIVDDNLQLISEGWHERFGEAHAEVNAIAQAGAKARGATLFVTLEPCCHFGKRPPCVDAVIAAGLRRVVVGMQDPFALVAGRGIQRLREANIEVEVGLLEAEVRRLAAPFCKLVEQKLPYVHAKWAMTLDGRIASRIGASQWISNAASRARVHQLRGRMDAILVGAGTAMADDPLLTARPAGPRVATRIVFDSRARLALDSQLVQTAKQVPLLVVTGPHALPENISRLREQGAEVMQCGPEQSGPDGVRPSPQVVLAELGRRQMTNVLVEGGSELLGAFFDLQLIDEVHIFAAPKLLGGAAAKSPLGGSGRTAPSDVPDLIDPEIELLDGDVYIHGPLRTHP
jgi:diaminohydroxyphosphoribosylaminopyrimidine deaminase/5-amino-6-(5-phosphoribosylamino)uracil reductase